MTEFHRPFIFVSIGLVVIGDRYTLWIQMTNIEIQLCYLQPLDLENSPNKSPREMLQNRRQFTGMLSGLEIMHTASDEKCLVSQSVNSGCLIIAVLFKACPERTPTECQETTVSISIRQWIAICSAPPRFISHPR